MEIDITNYITFNKKHNGQVKISISFTNQANCYKLLKEKGYGKTKLNGKVCYFQRTERGIIPVSRNSLKNAFREFLDFEYFKNIPDEIKHEDVMQWYYIQHPIKENRLFNDILNDELTHDEEHSLLLKTSHTYKHNFEIEQLLKTLKNWEFEVKKDQQTICSNSDLYFKKISGKSYLVFTHYAKNKGLYSGFDVWKAVYTNKNHIGNSPPLIIDDLKLGFNVFRDYSFIQPYLQQMNLSFDTQDTYKA